MDFVGFDGVSYSFPYLPSGLSSYEHFFIVEFKGSAQHIICFNGPLELNIINSSWYINYDSKNPVRQFSWQGSSFGWHDYGEIVQDSFATISHIVYASDDLLPYKDLLLSYDCYIDFSSTKDTYSVISDSLNNVEFGLLFSEIFSILPVVLVVCISFIAIRKGISFTRNLLVKS